MRKISKSLLSMALVIAMVLSIMPMSFAEGESGITIKYDIAGACMPDGAGNTTSVDTGKNPSSYCTDTKSNGFFEYVNDSVSKADGGNVKIENEFGLIYIKYNNWLILKINVPAAGEYKIYVNNNRHKNGGIGNFYISDSSTNILNADHYVGKIRANTAVEGMTSGIGNSWAMTLDIANVVKDNSGNDAVYNFKTAGEYYMAIQAHTDTELSGVSQNRFQFGNIWLVSGDGKGNTLIGDMTLSADSVKAGENATATATAYRSDDASLATLTYASSDTSVATVDPTSGVITAIKPGKTTISATAEGSVNRFEEEFTVTSANASGVTVTYDLMKYAADSTPHATLYNYDTTNGLFKYVWDYTSDAKFNWERKFINGTLQLASNRYEVFEINVPVAGEYDVKVEYGTDDNGMDMDVFVFKSNGEEKITHIDLDKQAVFGVVDCCNTNDTNTKVNPVVQSVMKNLGVYAFEKGKYFVAFQVPANDPIKYGFVSGFTIDGGDGEALIGKISGVSDELEVGENATAIASAYLSNSGNVAGNFTYSSSDSSILEVSASGEVKALSEGNAEIIVKSADAVGEIRKAVKVNVPVPTEPGETVEDTLVNFTFVSSDVAAGSVSAKGYPVVGEVAIGTSVEATATANDGYEFAYWRNGAGTVLSTEETATFKFNTNTGVFAEFIKIPDENASEVPVYFYNGNGSLLESKNVSKGTLFGDAKIANPSLTGFAFKHWSNKADESEIAADTAINSIFRAVAIYGDSGNKYTVTADGVVVTNDAAYSSQVMVTSNNENFKAWKLGDKIVSYNKSYTFYVWGDVALTSVTEGEVSPVATLTSVEGNPMLIYSAPADCEIIEAGILFGNGATISSYDSKAFAKESTGQFIAQPNGAEDDKTARGYLIFKKDGVIRVIYAD